jgi:antitoxin HicB
METTKTILSRPYARRLTPDESGGFVATIHEFPGCVSEGDNADEALRNLESAAASWIEAAQSLGQPIPDPIELGAFSGKVALRMSRKLHRLAVERAELENTSLNQLLVTAIAFYLGELDGLKGARSALRVEAAAAFDKVASSASRSNPVIYSPRNVAPNEQSGKGRISMLEI